MSGEPDWQKCFICQKNLPRQPLKKLHVSWTYEQSLEFLKNVHGNMQKLKNHVHEPDNPIVFTSYTPEALYDNDPVYHRSCRLAVSENSFYPILISFTTDRHQMNITHHTFCGDHFKNIFIAVFQQFYH